MEWKCLQKKFKTLPIAREGMFTLFEGSHGPVMEHYWGKDVVNSECSSEKLCDRLKLTVLCNASKGVVMLHDSTCSHTAAHAVGTFQQDSHHIALTPVPSVWNPIIVLTGHHFASNHEVREAVCL
jgi:hypothetical protein